MAKILLQDKDKGFAHVQTTFDADGVRVFLSSDDQKHLIDVDFLDEFLTNSPLPKRTLLEYFIRFRSPSFFFWLYDEFKTGDAYNIDTACIFATVTNQLTRVTDQPEFSYKIPFAQGNERVFSLEQGLDALTSRNMNPLDFYLTVRNIGSHPSGKIKLPDNGVLETIFGEVGEIRKFASGGLISRNFYTTASTANRNWAATWSNNSGTQVI